MGSMMNTTATCLTWKGTGSVMLYFASDSPCDGNKQLYHTRTVAVRVNKDHTFQHTPGQRCQVCYWCIIKDLWKRQHHYRHMKHKDTKSCRETPETNSRNGQVQMVHPWTLWNEIEELGQYNNRGRTQGYLQWKEDKHKNGIRFLVHKDIMNTCQGMSHSLQPAHHYPPEGSPFQHHNSKSVHPNVRLWWQWNRRLLWPATECHWSDTEEGHLVVQGDWNA